MIRYLGHSSMVFWKKFYDEERDKKSRPPALDCTLACCMWTLWNLALIRVGFHGEGLHVPSVPPRSKCSDHTERQDQSHSEPVQSSGWDSKLRVLRFISHSSRLSL